MKLPQGKISGILIGSVLAVLGLVAFQLTWMRYSQRLSEEIFNQRVSMALCSAVENYKGGILCSGAGCSVGSGDAHGGIAVASPSVGELRQDSAFNADLRKALDFYQIKLDFQLDTSPPKPAQDNCCSISLPAASNSNIQLSMTFPDKDSFTLGGMNLMVLATVLILLFTIAVLLVANWSLFKQKRLLQTNVDFFNNMAHEFRTPLTNMGLAVNMLARKTPELNNSPLLAILKKENERLMEEVDRVLHLASLDKGDHLIQKAPLSIKKSIQTVLDDMAMVISARNAVVHMPDFPETWQINADAIHLEKVFRNLLDNALKYSQLQPEIHISVSESPKGYLISFQDNGIGIPSSQCDLIFKKFQRATHGDIHDQKGFGLGLAYVKSIVELHKGSIRVKSEVNQGSRFDVYLPAMN